MARPGDFHSGFRRFVPHQGEAWCWCDVIREIRRERFEAEFEIWLGDLSDERRKAPAQAAPVRVAPNLSPGSRPEKAVLREVFAKESGMELPGE